MSRPGARPRCAQFVGDAYGPDYVPEKPNLYKAKSDAQDAHEAIRPTSMQYHPDAVRGASHAGPVLPVPVDLEPVRGVADAAGDVRRDDRRHHGRATISFRAKGSVPKFAGWMAVYNQEARGAGDERANGAPGPDARTAEDDEASSVLPPLAKGDDARAARAEAGAEVHAAAAALQRGDARQGARRERHRPAEHLRVDHHA